MPYKEEIIKYVVKKDTSVQVTQNANTIILKKKKLVAFNTDFLAVKKISKKIISNNIIIIGAGRGKDRLVAAEICAERQEEPHDERPKGEGDPAVNGAAEGDPCARPEGGEDRHHDQDEEERLSSILRRKVIEGCHRVDSCRLGEVDLRNGLLGIRGVEELTLDESERARKEQAREGLHRVVIREHGGVVMLSAEPDLILG